MWWKRKLDLRGVAYFRGELSPTLASLTGLAPAGVEVTPEEAGSGEIWAARLRHPTWGDARLGAPRAALPTPPAEEIATTPFLTDADRAALRWCSGRALSLEVPAAEGHVLRDRKRLLRFLAAVLHDDGLAGVDLAAQQFWTPPHLEEELSHDAPLDISQTHVLHIVRMDGGVWLHSHGLAELGFVDFDVLRPAPALYENQFDVLRAIAFSIAEGASSGAIEPVLGGDPIVLVDVRDFMRSASAADRLLRSGEGHDERRVVCCDPSGPGFLGRLFGRGMLRPSRLLERGMTEGRHLIRFSGEATELAAERARGSLSLLERFCAEFRDLGATPLVKLGYPADGPTSPDREHLWFEVHALGAGYVDATLVNEPHRTARMHAGQRDRHDTARLSDWCVVSPLGQITPHSTHLARRLRELPPEILEAMREAVRADRASGGAGR